MKYNYIWNHMFQKCNDIVVINEVLLLMKLWNMTSNEIYAFNEIPLINENNDTHSEMKADTYDLWSYEAVWSHSYNEMGPFQTTWQARQLWYELVATAII